MSAAAVQLIHILLVEDNPGDVRLTREALRDAKVRNEISVVPDGEEALAYLRNQGRYASARRPDLVILDLNLPKLNGLEVLRHVKQDPALLAIPIVILTSSDAEEDIARSYELHANCYIRKPVGFSEFMEVIHSIDDFWFGAVRLPPRGR